MPQYKNPGVRRSVYMPQRLVEAVEEAKHRPEESFSEVCNFLLSQAHEAEAGVPGDVGAAHTQQYQGTGVRRNVYLEKHLIDWMQEMANKADTSVSKVFVALLDHRLEVAHDHP